MLVLSRKTSERIFVGKDVVLTILKISGDNVRVGVEAPADVPVNREEVQQRIELERGTK